MTRQTQKIPVLVYPYSELSDNMLEGQWKKPMEDHVKACYHCGSPYMIIDIETVRETNWDKRREDPNIKLILGAMDHNFICAVCGRNNGGIFVDSDKDIAEAYPPEP